MGLFKSYSEKEVKRVMPLVKKINELEAEEKNQVLLLKKQQARQVLELRPGVVMRQENLLEKIRFVGFVRHLIGILLQMKKRI